MYKRKGQEHLALVQMALILNRNVQFKNFEIQNGTATDKTDNTKLSDKKSLKFNKEYLESDNKTNFFFKLVVYVETNNHVAYDELERIFDTNAIHCKDVKHSTFDDSEQTK